jgi:hypothetical protein
MHPLIQKYDSSLASKSGFDIGRTIKKLPGG